MDGIRRLGVVGTAAFALLAASAAAQDAGLRIVVLEGENSVNVIEQGTAVPTLVEVRDRDDMPVAGASVRFLLGEGGAATLNAGLSQVALTTNALGQAAVVVNPIAAGAVELSVSAAFRGETATAAIVQANFATAEEAAAAISAAGGAAAGAGGGGLGLRAMAVLAGAAVGGGLGLRAALAGDGDDDIPPGVLAGPPVSNARALLMEFYEATGGANWSNNTNWNTDAPLDEWYGVLTISGRVAELALLQNRLSGTIPASLGGLTNLFRLELGGNQLSGAIPSSLGGLTNLDVLHLGDNRLSGAIPASLGGLTNLRRLHLYNNRLSGAIPASLGGGLTNLEQLELFFNQLSGAIPASLGGLTNLKQLDFSSNQLSGAIPASLGDLTNLERLWLFSNQLSGAIPASLGGLTNLKQLELFSNQLSGAIPASLGGLTNLESLGLRNNQLSGSIPAALCRFENDINPQQGGVNLPCASSGGGELEVGLVPGDGRLEVHWTAPPAGGPATDGYDVRYRRAGGPGAPGGWTELAAATAGMDGRATITGLTNGAAYQVQVRAVAGGWSAAATGAPAARAAPVTFGGARIEDRRWRQYEEAAPLVLPAAAGGAGALTYALTPALPAGLAFDPAARTVSGTPSAPSPAATYTYAATDSAAPPSMASLTFTIEVEASAEEEALRRDALAAQGRALLSSVTGVVGERFRARRAGPSGGGGSGRGSAAGALENALAALPGMRRRGGPAASAGFGPGAVGDFSAPGSLGGPGGFLASGSAGGLSVGRFASAGGDGLVWGRSFQAPLGGGAAGGGASRYTVWGAGDRQSFSGTPEAGRYRGDLRSLYVGADGRLGADWLAGAAVGRSWGAADYAAASAGGAAGRLTTRMTSVYPYLRGRVWRGLELWAVGGYGRGAAADARGAEPFGEPGALTMAMTAAGLRQDVAEGSGVALSVVGGAGSLSLSVADGGPTVAGLAARVHRGRLALEASRASGAVSPFVQFGGRWDGGDGQTGAGVELVGGLRASTARLDLEARGRWLSAHSAAGYEEVGATARLAFRPRPEGTGLRAALTPRWGAAGEPSLGGDGLLGGAGAEGPRPGASWTPEARALSVEGEVGYGWRPRRLRGVLSPTASWRRTGFGGDVTRAGLSWLSSEDARRDVRMQLTLGRERWRERRAGYQLAAALTSIF